MAHHAGSGDRRAGPKQSLAARARNRAGEGTERDRVMSPLARKIIVALSVIVFAYVTAGYVLGRSSDDKAFRALTVYSEVLEHIQRDYVDEPNMHQVTSGALHGLLDSLDPQSGYMSPLEYTDYKEKSAN